MPDTNTPVATGATGSTAPASTPAAAPSSTPAISVSAGPASATPSSTPAAVQPVQGSPSAPPQERWEDILKNARAKTRTEVENEYRQKYSQYDAFERDPWSAVQSWLGEAGQHSLYGPMVQKWASQFVQGSQGAQEEPKADVPIADAQGNVTGYTFSDKQLKAWHKWSQAAQQQALDARLGPIEQQNAQYRQRDQTQAAYTQVNKTLTDLRKSPYFKDHEQDIRQALEDHEEWGDNVHAAYNYVLTTKILPTLGQAEQQKVIDSLQNKSTGATVSPGGTAPGRPVFKNFREAAEYFTQHPEEAEAMARRG